MKAKLISIGALIGASIAAPQVLPQAPQKPPEARLAPIPGALEEMLATALRSNPDILLAEAKVREAQATLNAARLKVTQDVVKAFHDRSRLENVIRFARVGFEKSRKLVETGQVRSDELEKAQINLIDSEIGLRQWEAQVRYLLGLGGQALGAAPVDAAPVESPVSARRPEMPKKLDDALKAPFNFELFEPQPLADLLKILRDITGLNILEDKDIDPTEPIRLSLKNSTLLGAFLAITDIRADLCFVVRDYGLMLTTRSRAMEIYAPTIPSDVFLSSGAVPSK